MIRSIIARPALALAVLLVSLAQRAFAQTPPEGPQPDAALSQLLAVLQDDAARADLIARLQTEVASAPEAAAAETATFARQVVELTTGLVARVGNEAQAIWREMSRLVSGDLNDRILAALSPAEWFTLGLTIASTIATLLLVQRAVLPLMRRMSVAETDGVLRRLWYTALGTVLRIAAVLVAWIAGYGLANAVLAGDETLFLLQSLYLNAFAAFGIARAALAAVASPDAAQMPSLTLAKDSTQRAIYRSLRPVLGIVLQGYLFVLPALQQAAGFAAVRPVRTLIATLAALVALWAVARILRATRPAQGAVQEEETTALSEGATDIWSKLWPPLAIVAVLYSWVTALTRPAFAAEVVVGGVAYSGLAVLLIIGSIRLMKGRSKQPLALPRGMQTALPELAPRLTALVAIVAVVLTVFLTIGALFALLHGWGAVDVPALLAREGVQTATWRIASALLVLLLAALVWAIAASVIDKNLRLGLDGTNQAARRRTLLGLFRNSFAIALATLTVMLVLSQLGLDIAPLLAGAGVIGLAIGFGSQKLVQDIITGVFIQFEGALNEGDVVQVAGISGGVEKVTIRSIRLRSLDGALHVIPFSSVDTVSNLTRDFSFHVAEIGVAYKESVPAVKDAMSEAYDRLAAEDLAKNILAPLDMQGVIALGDSAVVIRARIKTQPGTQWAIGRRYTELVKDVMDERGIEIPYPHRQVVFSGVPAGLLPPAAPQSGESAA